MTTHYADAVFAILPHLESTKALYDVIKRSALCSACLSAAWAREAPTNRLHPEQRTAGRQRSLVPLEGGLAILSGRLDFDLSTLPRHTVMAHRTKPKLRRIQTHYGSMTSKLLTLRQVTQIHGQTVGLPQMVGTPADVTDQLEAYFDFVGGDGFMLSPIYSRGRSTS